MNLGDIYYRSQELIGKDQFGKYFPPADFIKYAQWINQIGLMNKYIAEYEASRVISNNIRPFFKTLGTDQEPPLALNATGEAFLPDDFYYFSSSYGSEFTNGCGTFTETQNPIEWVDDTTFGFRTGSMMLLPTLSYPIATYRTRKSGSKYLPCIKVSPVMSSIVMTYLRQPKSAIFDYDIVNGTIIFLPPGTTHTNNSVLPIGTPSQSVDLEWPDSAKDDFVEMLIFNFARNIQDQLDIQISKQQGA